LAEGYKDQWIKMAAVELDESGDMEEARNKIVSAGGSPEMIQALINENQQTDPTLATQLAALLDIAQANTDAAAEQAEKVERSTLQSLFVRLSCFGGKFIIVLILVIFFSFY